MKFTSAIVLGMAAAVSAQVAPIEVKDISMSNTAGAQAQTCSTSHSFVKAGSLADSEGNFLKHDNLFHPNVEWEPVHHDLWSFDGTKTKHPHPLGFRQTSFKDEHPLCIKVPASSAQHKIELMVEYMANTKLCVQDIRQNVMNPEIEIVRDCDDKGRLIRCFSALSGKYEEGLTQEQIDTEAARKAAQGAAYVAPTNAPEENADFAIAIGCFGGGCRDDVANSIIYYRIRQSESTWEQPNNDPNMSGLDYWCMNLGMKNMNTVGFRDAGIKPEQFNDVPQKYPTDLWTAVNRDNGEAFDTTLGNNPADHNGSATTVAMSVASILLPLVAMML